MSKLYTWIGVNANSNKYNQFNDSCHERDELHDL